MSQASVLINTLKRSLKAKGYSYRNLADHLQLSEASVKYMFSQEKISLQRLEEVCHFIGMELSDLIHAMETQYQKTDKLTEEQEAELTSDPRLLLTAFVMINGGSFEELTSRYTISDTDAIQYLARLDRLRIIELLPGNRVKLLVSAKFSWRKQGPIQSFFTSQFQDDFLSHPFNAEDSTHYFLTAMLSKESENRLADRIKQLVSDFREYNQEDLHLPLQDREVFSMLVAARSWRPKVFDGVRRYE